MSKREACALPWSAEGNPLDVTLPRANHHFQEQLHHSKHRPRAQKWKGQPGRASVMGGLQRQQQRPGRLAGHSDSSTPALKMEQLCMCAQKKPQPRSRLAKRAASSWSEGPSMSESLPPAEEGGCVNGPSCRNVHR